MPTTSYLRLKPLPFSSLPPHPSLTQSAEWQQNVNTFLTTILTEAQTLISTTIPQNFKTDRKLRSSAPSSAKVQLSTSSGGGGGAGVEDYWVCRKSIHTDSSAQRGSASWAEFEKGLRENHSENEMDYTPSVASVEHLVKWPVVDELEGWRGIDMHVSMITHTFKPAGLISPRAFISLIISAYEPESTTTNNDDPIQGFYTIQIPLLFQKDSSNNDVPDAIKQQVLSTVPKNTIFAHYVSVERVRLLPPATADANAERRIEWIMATTSDAGGQIPQWVQRSWTMGGVPKAVVADVGLFLGWVDKKRSSSSSSSS
ncbi:hypothetical protein TMatcc_005926 [Talaromyces marneffei ATCC 18224]|uniref:DUF3074 domain-containing protein n=1 Tax=Talaromyces marneffei (strain ATCC 18224 / CBS 334.59 / QM 7333) TaxID=441960 RepID=B6Q8N2_TALMQ|nr:uncharacterized protein EYB26_005579 [Talaromyces marneffei]EEA25836.1 conserved hypothetical protein [Talaromyces marneffei ATCC 18224]QGA17903.1 hypothetical protein EYB26_005579 [Talaromyces marneffei]